MKFIIKPIVCDYGVICVDTGKVKGTYEEMVTFQLGAIVTILTDISKSLAILADNTESKKNVSKIWKKCCPSKEIVREWRKLNPLGRKIQCYKDTKLSRPTIDKYWDLVLQEE